MEQPIDIDITDSGTWPEWLTFQQVAQILQCNVNLVRTMVEAGTLRSKPFGKRSERISKTSVMEGLG